MALARTNLLGEVGQPSPTNAAYVTAGSFTPPNSSLLVVAVAVMEISGTTDPTGDVTISGGGWTYTPRVTIGTTASWSMGLIIYTAPVTTGASMSLTLDCAARAVEFFAVSAVAYTGYNTGSPIGATASDVDTATPDGAASMTLSGAPATDSEVFAALGMDKESLGVTQGAAFTEIHDLEDTFNSGGLESEIRTGSASTTVDWVDTHTGTGSIFKYLAAAIEVKAAAGAAAVPPILAMGPRVY